MDDPWNELLLSLEAYLLIGAGGIVVALGLLGLAPYFWRRPLPVPRLRPGRWWGGEVMLAFVNALFFAPFAVLALMAFLIVPASPDPRAYEAAVRAAAPRLLILGSPMTFVLTLAVFTAVLFAVSRTRPHHLGVTWARWPANVILGVLTFLVLAPLTLGVYSITTLAFPADQHPFKLLVAQGLDTWEWALLVFMTVAGAPLIEESLFRGILQGWLRRASLIGHSALLLVIFAGGAAPLAAVVMAEVAHQVQPDQIDPPTVESAVAAIAPLVFYGLFVVAYAGWLWRLRICHGDGDRDEMYVSSVRERAGRRWAQQWAYARLSIFGSAMLFALAHGWPQAIPLFVLALGLGWLALRTQSLIGPMVCHALFNAVACLVLAWGG